MRILEILLVQSGALVTREELKKRVWPSDVHLDFEVGLNGAIKRLRLALDAAADCPIFIEAVPKGGYRFIAPVQRIVIPADIAEQTADSEPVGVTGSKPAAEVIEGRQGCVHCRHGSLPFFRGDSSNSDICGPPIKPPLRVIRIVELSNSGHARSQESLFSDGPRLYYTPYDLEIGTQLRQILLDGNEDIQVAGISPDSVVRGISPDGTTFLSDSAVELNNGRPSLVSMIPAIGGPPRRFGSFFTNDIAWSPDGNSFGFAKSSQLVLAGRW